MILNNLLKYLKQIGSILVVSLLLSSNLASKIINVNPGENGHSIETALARAAAGDTIMLAAGRYSAPLEINKSIFMLGENRPEIAGDKNGTVLTISADNVVLSGLKISGSGAQLVNEDAGIAVNASGARIEDTVIEDVLFGIYLKQADKCIIRNNRITGKIRLEIARRGDLVRAWYSNELLLENNILKSGRDVIIWFSNNSVIRNNNISGARYGLHFMYSNDCRVEDNFITGNSVGTYLMYSRRIDLINNTFTLNRGPSGFGIGIKDFDDGIIEANLIADNKIGIFVDNAPREITSSMFYTGNIIALNDQGIAFMSSPERSHFKTNSFIDNYEQVSVSRGNQVTDSTFIGNYWSDYTGFDKNENGIGDLPYQSRVLYEDLIARKPDLRLFIHSPSIQALNFAARLFPVVEPKKRLADVSPLMEAQFTASVPLPAGNNHWFLFATGLGLLYCTFLITWKRKKTANLPVSRAGNNKNMQLSGTNDTVIDVVKITKSFGKKVVLDQVEFKIAPGETIVLWGANGAGKTTLLRCILGLFEFEGSINISGKPVSQFGKYLRQKIGFVPQELQFHDNLTVEDTLEFYAAIKKTEVDWNNSWLKQSGLVQYQRFQVNQLSGGMKQRLALAIALLTDPPFLFLDEPTSNLDIKSRREFLHLLIELKNAGKTILFSSHRLEEIYRFADRIIVLENGKVSIDESPNQVFKILGKHPSVILFVNKEHRQRAREILAEHDFEISPNGEGIKVRVQAEAKAKPITLLNNSGITIENFDYEIE